MPTTASMMTMSRSRSKKRIEPSRDIIYAKQEQLTLLKKIETSPSSFRNNRKQLGIFPRSSEQHLAPGTFFRKVGVFWSKTRNYSKQCVRNFLSRMRNQLKPGSTVSEAIKRKISNSEELSQAAAGTTSVNTRNDRNRTRNCYKNTNFPKQVQ